MTCIYLYNKKEELILCSAYQDINFPEVINNSDKAANFAKVVHKEILIGTDTNAHSHLLWDRENKRGEIFNEFLFRNNLSVTNTGNKCTYHLSQRVAPLFAP